MHFFPSDYRRNIEIVKHLSELVFCVASHNHVVLKGYLYSTGLLYNTWYNSLCNAKNVGCCAFEF